LTHSEEHAFAPVSLLNTSPVEPVNNNVSATTKMCGKFFDTIPIGIQSEHFIDIDNCSRITEINFSHYEGFVYTLETKEQMYDINSVVAKNCRCTVVFVPIKNENNEPVSLRANLPASGVSNVFMRIAAMAASFSITSQIIDSLIESIESDTFI